MRGGFAAFEDLTRGSHMEYVGDEAFPSPRPSKVRSVPIPEASYGMRHSPCLDSVRLKLAALA